MDVPRAVRRLLRRTLAKDFRQRLQHIGDARLELEEIGNDTNEPSAAGWRRSRAVPVLLGAAALIAIAAGLASWLAGRRPTAHTESAVARLMLKIEGETAEQSSTLRWTGSSRRSPSRPTACGSSFAHAATDDPNSFCESCQDSKPGPFLVPRWQQRRSSHPTASGSASGERRIVSSAKSRSRAVLRSKLLRPTSPIVALWTSNDEIVIEGGDQNGELWSIPASGGTPKAIAVRDRSAGELISLRARVPGSNDLLVASTGADGTWLEVLSRETGKRRRLLRGGSNVAARYTGTGHLVFSDGDALRAVPVNQRFEPVGDPTPSCTASIKTYRHSNVAVSDNGTVIYVPADRVREAELLWLDREGNATPVPGGRVPFRNRCPLAGWPGGRG